MRTVNLSSKNNSLFKWNYYVDFTSREWSTGSTPPQISCTRGSSATYFDSSGVLQTAGNNVARVGYNSTGTTCLGLLIEGSCTNFLLNSGAPATQTTASLAVGFYCLWITGTGSATSSAGTAVGTGFGAATSGSPNFIHVTTAGTVTVTVSGSPSTFQLENQSFPSSYIATTGTTATRSADQITILAGYSSPAGQYLNGSQGTVYCNFLLEGVDSNIVGAQWVFALNPTSTASFGVFANSTNNQLQIGTSTGGDAVVSHVWQSNVTSSTMTSWAAINSTGSIWGALSGGGSGIGTNIGSLPQSAVLSFGQRGNNTRYLFGYIQKIGFLSNLTSLNVEKGFTQR